MDLYTYIIHVIRFESSIHSTSKLKSVFFTIIEMKCPQQLFMKEWICSWYKLLNMQYIQFLLEIDACKVLTK